MLNKFLVVRTDRLGDVLLTTPVSSALREAFPKAQISWLVRPYAAPLLEHNPDVDRILLDRGGSVGELTALVKKENFDAAIVAYPRWRVAWALWRAGIPVRIGPASKWYSIFFTHKIWQHRSEGKKHEADYNLELLAPLGVPFKRRPARFVLTEEEKKEARKALESHRLSFVVTGGPGEDYQTIMIDQMHRVPVFIAAGSVSVRELAALYSCADLVVTNSTGPLHLAVALGVPTVSIYSPLATCHPQRWGPYPAYVEHDKKHGVFIAPLMETHGDKQEDMAAVSVQQVWDGSRAALKRRLL